MTHIKTNFANPGCQNDRSKWVISFALLVVLVTTLPYLMGFEAQGENWRFTGFVFGVEDGNSYLAKMLRGSSGDWLFRTPYTAVNQPGAFFFLPYLLLGKLAAPPGLHEQLVALYHIFRIFGVILATAATYDFLALFLRGEALRRWGVALVTLGGGLGWLLVLLGREHWLGSLPLDFFSPETFGFLGTFGIAHLTWARAFLLWGLRAYLLHSEGGDGFPGLPFSRRLSGLPPGVLWLLTGFFQPLAMVVFGAVVGFHLIGLLGARSLPFLLPKDDNGIIIIPYLSTAIWSGLVAFPFGLYVYLAFRLDPYLSAWMEQNVLPAPHLLHYLLAYGLVLPLALGGAVCLARRGNERGLFLITWAMCAPLLLTLPISAQRRLLEGEWVALVGLALVFIEAWPRIWRFGIMGLLTLSFLTSVLLVAGGMQVASLPAMPAFRPVEEVAAFQFIAERATTKTVVLSSHATGNALPAWTPVFVVIGHGPESAEYASTAQQVEAFYKMGISNQERIDLLCQFGVDFVFWGPVERKLGEWDPSSVRYLSPVFRQGVYVVFQVDLQRVEPQLQCDPAR